MRGTVGRDERRQKFIQITPMNISYSLSTQQNAKRIEKKEKQKMSEKNLFNIKEFSTYRTLLFLMLKRIL